VGRTSRAKVVVALAGAFAVLGASTANAQTPPTLTGEVLTQHTAFTGSATGNCSTNPTTGVTSYSLSFAGLAVGPYPGTFTEQISATIGPPATPLPLPTFPDTFVSGPSPAEFLAAGQLLSLDAAFTIDSPTGEVSGTKTLSAVVVADPSHAGVCADLAATASPLGLATGSYKDVRAFDLSYTATITTAEAGFHDEGTAQAEGRQGHVETTGGFLSDVNDFAEAFQSTLASPTPTGGQGGGGTKPGKGCGDKNHVHEREAECHNPPR
jgi:hypothetical protein